MATAADCKSVVSDIVGSSPASPTICRVHLMVRIQDFHSCHTSSILVLCTNREVEKLKDILDVQRP